MDRQAERFHYKEKNQKSQGTSPDVYGVYEGRLEASAKGGSRNKSLETTQKASKRIVFLIGRRLAKEWSTLESEPTQVEWFNDALSPFYIHKFWSAFSIHFFWKWHDPSCIHKLHYCIDQKCIQGVYKAQKPKIQGDTKTYQPTDKSERTNNIAN